MTETIIRAPFSADQAESLNAFQESEYVHPYTCRSPECPAASWAGEDDWLPMAGTEPSGTVTPAVHDT